MARPKKQPHEKRDQRFNLRFTTAERLHIETQARAAGIDPTEYLRRRALGFQVSPAPSATGRADPALISELNRIGVNLNQLAYCANAGKILPANWRELSQKLQALLVKMTAAYGS
ncbi:MAG: plasmid mobilization relaxosome protein MobC [Verrucomicrobiae bacterium]|nr:plasmid mobilization relaxosome protein MobC [Verrucomicrobiae bacterium]